MFKKLTTAFTASAIAVLGLVSIVSASTGDSFDITGLDQAAHAPAAKYINFTIANSDPNEEGEVGGAKVQAALVVEQPIRMNIGAGDDNDKPTGSLVKLNIGASDPAEQA
jgi:hypothetical protein